MKRLLLGLVPLLALVGVACNTEPTDDLRNGVDRLVATPTQLFLELGQTKTVEVSGLDAQGNPQSLTYEVTDHSAGIDVKRDSTFRPNFVNDSTLEVPSQAPTFRFIVTSLTYSVDSFTVSAGGKSLTIRVQTVPQNVIAATFSDDTVALGDTVTVTAAPGTSFTQTAQIFFGDTTRVGTIVERDPNGQFIRFIPPPSVNGGVIISEVVSVSAPTEVFSPTTATPLVTPLIDSVDVSYSTTAPTIGQTVTMTIVEDPVHIKFAAIDSITFLTVDSIQFPGVLPGPAAGPQNVRVAADSTSLTFEAPPNVTGPATVTSFTFPGGYIIPLPTTPAIVTPNVGNVVNATFSDSTPDRFVPITITLPPEFLVGAVGSFTVQFGGVDATVNSVGGGGSTIDVVPGPGSTGFAVITGLFPTGAPQFLLQLPTIHTITVPGLTPLEGTSDPTTAPTIITPAVGATADTVDAGTFDGADITGDGGVGAQYYKFDMPADGDITITLNWGNSSDVDLIVCDDVAGVLDPSTCQFDGASTAQPESATFTLTTGTHYVAAVLFDGSAPTFITLELAR